MALVVNVGKKNIEKKTHLLLPLVAAGIAPCDLSRSGCDQT